MPILSTLWRKFCFWAAYVHRQSSFPYVTWDNPRYRLEYPELLQALQVVKPGDIGLRRIDGYLSNIAIPGFFKHSFIFTSPNMIVEALDTGVEERHPLYPMLSDYAIILRPRGVSRFQMDTALAKVNSIIGRPYDTSFSFDIEDELSCSDHAYMTPEIVNMAQSFAKKDKCAFTCTEVIAYAYWHVRQQLGLFRHDTTFRNGVIIPDDFLNTGWDIVWCSSSCASYIMQRKGLHQAGIAKIERYSDSFINRPC